MYSASYGGCNVFGKGSCRSVCLSFKERKLYMLFSLRIVLDQILWSSTSPSYVDCDWWKSFSTLGHHGWRSRQDNPHWCPFWIAEAACQIEIWPHFIVTSATVDAEKFSGYFFTCNIFASMEEISQYRYSIPNSQQSIIWMKSFDTFSSNPFVTSECSSDLYVSFNYVATFATIGLYDYRDYIVRLPCKLQTLFNFDECQVFPISSIDSTASQIKMINIRCSRVS